ncbi:putative HD superfamily hydrolase [Desulfosporosinus acidiphilus SJ4]|uniref:Putative HD superfamily hydrolase n=1 Tax=Desulfosporosinus acidiphilus (strain DSM 22704 / JCM 16185 / SJ4) TaxID=646529 RepID=I4D072_DESAJ|nr:HD domain-containing protein [Desulfosporosinus acidiphilus]AFM39196.1 putative HD superfamily hydrolase [Desulfosporosinus acidiphilus SJ4]
MTRLNCLLDHQDYLAYQEMIDQLEKSRQFCKHGFDHGLNVARIGYAYILEQGGQVLSKEVVYAAAFLHDIGRWVEYKSGEDHAEASAKLALPILEDCKFNSEETKIIVEGIREHRRHSSDHLSLLGRALALADDWARDCRHCSTQKQCYKYNHAMSLITY